MFSSLCCRPVRRLLALFTAAALCGLLTARALAADWYVAPNGNDSNSGTLAAPFATVMKAQTAASAGDTVYLRGGTYATFSISFTDANYNYVHRLSKSGLTWSAYPGEIPLFDFSSVPTNLRVCGFHVTGSSLVVKGVHVTGVKVGSQKQSECWRIDGSGAYVDFYDCVSRDNAANGFYWTNRSRGSAIRCDAYNNIGTNGDAIGNTDGFGAHGNGVIHRYCRAWNNSDDGYDSISSPGANVYDHCWAFNHRAGGDSNGFKVGGFGAGTDPSTLPATGIPVHTVTYCLAANNGSHGFYANHQPGQSAVWTYNTAFGNSSANYNMLERQSDMSADVAGFREVLHFNIAYSGTTIVNDNNPAASKTNNSWTKPGVVSDASDFLSTDWTQLMAPRSAGNNLPFVTFMHLTPSSDLAGLGCFAPPPAAPTALQAAWTTSSQVRVTWTPSPGATTYYVKRATTSGGPYVTIAARLTETDYADNTVTSGTTYFYRVSAMDDISYDEGVSAEATAILPQVAITGISTDTGRSASDGITKDTTLVLVGTAAPNSTLAFSQSGTGQIGGTTAAANGEWSFDYTGIVLPEGAQTFQAVATDPSNGAVFTADPFVALIDVSVPAAPGISSITNGSDSVVVSGNAEPVSEVAVTRDGTLSLGEALAGADGNWSLTYLGATSGSHSFTAVATDRAGNVSPLSPDFTVDTSLTPPIIVAAQTDSGAMMSGSFTRDATVVLTGTATLGHTVAITRVNAGVIGTSLADVNGNWSFDYTGMALPDGVNQFTATGSAGGANSAASNVFTLNVDVVPPAVALIVRQSPASATVTSAVASVIFRVSFNESVLGVDAADFTLTTTGGASGVIAAVSGNGAIYDVTVNDLTGAGTLRLDLAAASGVADPAGNSAAGYTSGEAYTRVISTAGNGTWTEPATGGLWSDPQKWLNAVIPNGATHTANFNTLDLLASNTVRLDAPRTVNSLTFGDTAVATTANWRIDDNGNAANILTLGGAVPTITVNALGTGSTASISARLTGGSGLTKAGGGTLALSGANTLGGTLAASAGVLRVDAGGNLTGSTLAVNAAGAQLQVNGGALSVTGTTTITGATNTGVIINAGSASFASVTFTNASGGLFRIAGGTTTVNTLTLPRSSDAAISYATGFVIAGGTSTIGTISLGTGNSNGVMSVEGGDTTVSGIITVGNQTTGGRGGAFRVTGGTFTSTHAAAGLVLARTNGANANNVTQANFLGGVSTLERLTLGFDGTVTAGSGTVTVAGGALYLGSGGIVKNGSAGMATTIALTSGTLGAKASWSTNHPLSLTSGGNINLKAGSAADAPFDLTLNGVVSGAGGFTKTGAGTLTLAGTSTYAGTTTVNSGVLALTGSVTNTSLVEVKPGARLHFTGTLTTGTLLIHAGGQLSGAGMINADVVNDGLISASGSANFIVNGNLTNTGSIRLVRGAGLTQSAGNFINNGVLDVITAGVTTLPTLGSNQILDATSVRASGLNWFPGMPAELTALAFAGHTFQLQRSVDLSSWENVGTPVNGTGANYVFSDPTPPVNTQRIFYRVAVDL